MRYHLTGAAWGPGFAVPSALVDRHIRLAGGNAFKALLLLLRHPDTIFDEQALSAMTGIPAADLTDALAYWVEAGVLAAGDALPESAAQAALPAAPQAEGPAAPAAAAEPAAAKAAPISSLRPRYPRDEVLSVINGDKVLTSLVPELQTILGKPLTSADLDVLLGLYSYYGLSAHFILTLLHYCVKIGRQSMGYAESVAVSWLSEGVDDATVDRQVDRLLRRRSNEGRIKAAFGLERALTSSQREMACRWLDEWDFSLEMVTLAYEIAVERTGKVAFAYIDKILASWHQQGVKTPKQAKNEPKPDARSAKGASKKGGSLNDKILQNLIKE